jgi:hypothetical protein
VITNPWDQQTGESDEWHGRFVVYLGLGYGRTLSKAYRLVHPESEATEVSSAWRQEYKDRRWRQRATDHDLTLFRDQAKENAVILGRAMRAFAKKSLRALRAKEPAMQPSNWEEAAKAFETLSKMFPAETIHAFCQEEPVAVKGADGESLADLTDLFPRETLAEPPVSQEPMPPP